MFLKVKVQKGATLLAYLRDNLDEYPSVKAIKRAIDAKQCMINGRVEFFSTHPVKAGDEIEINLTLKTKKETSEILYEDSDLIIFNKISGVPSEAFEGYHLVHRLDKETSGAFLLAKTAPMRDRLTDLFAKREVDKEYLAICDGKVTQERWVVDNYLGKKASYQGGVLFGRVPKETGKRAVTHFECLEVGESASLVRALPITGRTHQIRVHLKGSNYPVLGDWQYTRNFVCPHHPPRLMLHAKKLEFVHPVKMEKLAIEAPLFSDFLETKKSLFKSY